MLSEEATITNFIVFGSNTQSTALEASMLHHYTTDAVNKLKIISEFLVIKIAEILMT